VVACPVPPDHLAISEPADTVLLPLLSEQSVGTTWHFPCLWTRAVCWADQVLPGSTWNSWCLDRACLLHVRTVHSGKYWNCMTAVKIPELPHKDCGQDEDLLMTEVNHLATL